MAEAPMLPLEDLNFRPPVTGVGPEVESALPPDLRFFFEARDEVREDDPELFELSLMAHAPPSGTGPSPTAARPSPARWRGSRRPPWRAPAVPTARRSPRWPAPASRAARARSDRWSAGPSRSRRGTNRCC